MILFIRWRHLMYGRRIFAMFNTIQEEDTGVMETCGIKIPLAGGKIRIQELLDDGLLGCVQATYEHNSTMHHANNHRLTLIFQLLSPLTWNRSTRLLITDVQQPSGANTGATQWNGSTGSRTAGTSVTTLLRLGSTQSERRIVACTSALSSTVR